MIDIEKRERFLVSLAEILEVEIGSIEEDTLLDNVEWDSLAIVSSIAIIDEHFNVMVPGIDLEKCQSIKNIITLIESKLDN